MSPALVSDDWCGLRLSALVFCFQGWVICWTKRFSQGIPELNEPCSPGYSWLKDAKMGRRKICFVLSSRDQGFVWVPSTALHCSCHCPHPPGPHDGQWLCFRHLGKCLSSLGKALLYLAKDGGETLWLRLRTAFWSDQLCLSESQTQKSFLFSSVSYLSRPWDWVTVRDPRRRGLFPSMAQEIQPSTVTGKT